MIPPDLHYSREHEWVRLEERVATVGISDYAQNQLGDVVFVELPAVGTVLAQFKPFGVVESVKAASDLFSPLSGTVSAVNQELVDHPELINQDPYGGGWMIRIDLTDVGEIKNLLSADQYTEYIGGLG
ncbi:MAG: glycine cleavage system protein GcvH [Chloroflexi bacterium]|nr:glycine cleavage system protein GcvH [Chloroflexota bacterium]